MRIIIFIFIFIFIFMLIGCDYTDKKPQLQFRRNVKTIEKSTPLAFINDVPITLHEFQSWKRNIKFLRKHLPQKRVEMLFQGYLKHRVLIEASRKNGFDTHPSVVKAMEQAMIRVFVRERLQKKIRSRKPTEKEVHQYYLDHLDLFTRPERRKVSLIFIRCSKEKRRSPSCFEKINALYLRLKRGEDFSFLARNHSEESFSRGRGGDLGFIFPLGDQRARIGIDSIVTKTAYTMNEKNTFSKPVRGKNGFFIVKVSGMLRKARFPYQSQRSKARSFLIKQRREQITKQFFLNLKKEFNVRIEEKEIKNIKTIN